MGAIIIKGSTLEYEHVNSEKEAMFETYAFPMKDEIPGDDTDEIS